MNASEGMAHDDMKLNDQDDCVTRSIPIKRTELQRTRAMLLQKTLRPLRSLLIVMSCALHLLPGAAFADNEFDVLNSLQKQVRQLRASGQSAAALPFAQDIVRRGEKIFASQPQNLTVVFNERAGVYIDQRKYAEAEALYQRSIRIADHAFGPNNPSVSVSLYLLAVLYDQQGQYGKAALLLERSLTIINQGLGVNDSINDRNIVLLAVVFQAQGRYSDAEPLFQQSGTRVCGTEPI